MVPLTRRRLLKSASAWAAAGFMTRPPAWGSAPPVSLGEAAAGSGLLSGSAFDIEVLDDPAYGQLVAGQSTIMTLANAVKFDWLRPHGPDADFTHADRMLAFAEQAGAVVRGAAPVWNDWLPEWLKSKSTAELQHIFDSHVDQLVGRYAGRIRYWDLVNEPFVPLWYREQGWRRGAWFDAFGPDYITRALQRAAVADPKARLFINEAALEQDDEIGQSLRPHVLNQLRRIVDSGAPLHGFGVESHLRPGLPHDYSAFADWLAQIGELGLEIHITELDVFDDPFPDDFAARDAAVAGIYTDYLNAVLAVPQVKAVVFWGLKESYGFPYWMWKNANKSEGRAPRGLLYDDTLQPRPAHDAAIAALRGASKRSSLER